MFLNILFAKKNRKTWLYTELINFHQERSGWYLVRWHRRRTRTWETLSSWFFVIENEDEVSYFSANFSHYIMHKCAHRVVGEKFYSTMRKKFMPEAWSYRRGAVNQRTKRREGTLPVFLPVSLLGLQLTGIATSRIAKPPATPLIVTTLIARDANHRNYVRDVCISSTSVTFAARRLIATRK